MIMKYTIENDSLFLEGEQVNFVNSPNQSGSIIPEYLVEHYTADLNPEGTISWFKSKESAVSAHLLIDREGKITQFVKFNKKAWHAGESSWRGLKGLNSFSIGIEMVNAGRLTKVGDKYFFQKREVPADQVLYATEKNESEPSYWQTYTDIQIEVCKEVTDTLVKHYNLKDVVGHEDIAPGRKVDPGPAFPLDKMKPLHNPSLFTPNSNLNMRTGAGTNFKITEVIPEGKIIIELNRIGDWSRVNYQGRLGWVNNKYLTNS